MHYLFFVQKFKNSDLIPQSTIIVQNYYKIDKEMRCKIVDFGSTLKELRLQAGLTQKQLAVRMNITKSVVSYYELGERCPSPEVLTKIAAIFHVSTDYLLGIEKSPTIDISGLDEEDICVIRLMVERLRLKNKRY